MNIHAWIVMPRITVLLIELAVLTSCSESYVQDFISERNMLQVEFCGSSVSSVLENNLQISWNLIWYDDDGIKHERENCAQNEKIMVSGNSFTPILARPILSEHSILLSSDFYSGGIFPTQVQEKNDKQTVLLCPKKAGEAQTGALVLCRSRESPETGAFIASHFNWNRFSSTVQGLSHPQWLDTELAAAAILSGGFTVYKIKEKNKTAVKFTLMDERIVPGTVFYEFWNNEIAFELQSSRTISIELPDGLFYFFSVSGYVTLQVKKAHILCAFYTPYRLKD